jgi:hypothetical protein
MQTETRELIIKWIDVYQEYHTHVNRTESFEKVWIPITEYLMQYWDDQEKGEIAKLWESFPQMLRFYVAHYERMNANFRRGMPAVETKGTGGRWLP